MVHGLMQVFIVIPVMNITSSGKRSLLQKGQLKVTLLPWSNSSRSCLASICTIDKYMMGRVRFVAYVVSQKGVMM